METLGSPLLDETLFYKNQFLNLFEEYSAKKSETLLKKIAMKTWPTGAEIQMFGIIFGNYKQIQ